MFQDEVEKVELPAIEQLTRLGWTYVPGADLAPTLPVDGAPVGESGYYRDVVLSKRLEAADRFPYTQKLLCKRWHSKLTQESPYLYLAISSSKQTHTRG